MASSASVYSGSDQLQGLSLGAWVAGGISGGHINPAVRYLPASRDRGWLTCTQVTIAMATFRGFPWRKVPGYILAQYFGAWLGAIVVYANYFHAINLVDNHQYTVPGTAAFFGAYAVCSRFLCRSRESSTHALVSGRLSPIRQRLL